MTIFVSNHRSRRSVSDFIVEAFTATVLALCGLLGLITLAAV